MKKKKRKVSEYFLPGDPGIIREAGKEGNLEEGLSALASVWKKGGHPTDLTDHFSLTWLAFENGNVIRAARRAGTHRITLAFVYQGMKIRHPNPIKLRKIWQEVCRKNNGQSFADRVGLFCRMEGSKPSFGTEENRGLVNLWLMGFPLKVLRPHYMIWALGQGKTRKEISRILGRSVRNVQHHLKCAVTPGNPAYKWLKSMKGREERKDSLGAVV